ncbi:hypothetical protein ApDm4_0076 [Acetobacter pomorum]|nr:hypothetical protein ApDm4_0076 [Acetobacter pomorum]
MNTISKDLARSERGSTRRMDFSTLRDFQNEDGKSFSPLRCMI